MNQKHNWQDLTVESKVVASGRPAKKAVNHWIREGSVDYFCVVSMRGAVYACFSVDSPGI